MVCDCDGMNFLQCLFQHLAGLRPGSDQADGSARDCAQAAPGCDQQEFSPHCHPDVRGYFHADTLGASKCGPKSLRTFTGLPIQSAERDVRIDAGVADVPWRHNRADDATEPTQRMIWP